ncbi:MAG: Hsp20/alpha crystallin family protein [Chloroflexota bacterium]|nr:Hsp20/alpha crystallin family protein [Chloroflexota bacterium]
MIVVRRGRPRDPGRRTTEIDDVLRALLAPGGAVAPQRHGRWRPPLEVYETEIGFIVNAEVGGMEREQIDVVIEGDVLVITGTRPDGGPNGRRMYHEARIPYGEFGAEVVLPFAVDGDSAEATYDGGILRVILPRLRGRTIVPRSAHAPRDTETETESE